MTPGCDCDEDVNAPQVDTLDATDIMSLSTALNGNLRSLGSASRGVEVWFRWRSASDSGYSETPKQTMTSTGPFSAQIIGTMPGTTYYFRACVAVEDHTGWDDDKSFCVP